MSIIKVDYGELMEGGIDLLNPDVQFDNSTPKSSGTIDIAVTKKPRWIVLTLTTSNSSGIVQFAIVDVSNNVAYRKGYWDSAERSWSNWTNFANYFPTISDTKVTYNYGGWGGLHRVYINIYY